MTDDDKSDRTYTALAIGFVCIVIGVPLWWKTTEVYRVQLPYSEISELSVPKISCAVHVTVVLFTDEETQASLDDIKTKILSCLSISDSQSLEPLSASYVVTVRLSYEEERLVHQRSSSLAEFDAKLSDLHTREEHGSYTVLALPSSTWLPDQSKGWVGGRRASYITYTKDKQGLISFVCTVLQSVYVNEPDLLRVFTSSKSAEHDRTDKEGMRKVQFHPGYEVTFTLLNPQPEMFSVDWGIEQAVEDYFQPFTDVFTEYVNITVKSQVLHYVGLNRQPKKDGNNFYWTLDDLPHIINPIEGHLSSHVSNNPNLNFIVYIPSSGQAPLYVYNDQGAPSDSNAFLSPRWGGLLIHNLEPPQHNATLPQDVTLDMRVVMEVFISQLRLLLGIPQQPSTVTLDIVNNVAITLWELDAWLRSRTVENLATSSATLQSLAQLLGQISNIVINDDIGREVFQAVEMIKLSRKYLADGHLKSAFLTSKQASISSEKAFFDPSLLELLYFPEDQKFAIYIPLFLPISIPVVMSLIQAAKQWKSRKNLKVE